MTADEAPRRVLVVDDHPVFRRGLAMLLGGEPWVAGVAEAATVDGAVREAVVTGADVVAMDVHLPDGDGIEATRRILAARPATGVLMVTMADDEELVARALRVGARGYVLKETDPEAILEGLRTVARGGVVLGPRIGPAVLASLGAVPESLPPELAALTERERELLAHLVGGRSNAQIARALGLSEKTVRNGFSAVFAKLGVGDRVQAALKARDLGVSDAG